MKIDKQTVLDVLRERGEDEKAAQAEQELPDEVDTEQHAGLLERFGVNPSDLIGRVTGGGQGMPGI